MQLFNVVGVFTEQEAEFELIEILKHSSLAEKKQLLNIYQ